MILAIDQGTTGTTTIVYDSSGNIVAKAYAEIKQLYPQPGWVEHNPIDIWNSVTKTISEVCNKIGNNKIKSIGITNQRETVVVWNKKTGKPVHNAIVWQCRRTAEMCHRLRKHIKKFL